jgi:hypothetical protein
MPRASAEGIDPETELDCLSGLAFSWFPSLRAQMLRHRSIVLFFDNEAHFGLPEFSPARVKICGG